jgi:hypothetical protein
MAHIAQFVVLLSVWSERKLIEFWGLVTPHLYENIVVLFMWFCMTVTEFVFGVSERRVTESEHTLGGMCHNM